MPDSAILVPLYIYPFPGAWEPLYTAIEANPRTQFLVIVNPGNGPGPAPLPDANYCREIPKLKSHSNVAVFGYVHVNWARRRLDEVCKDVEIYAAWPVQQQQQQQGHLDTQQPPHQDQDVSDGRLAIDGIFVDETPIEAREHEVAFLGSLTKLAHSIWPSVPAAATSGTPVSDSGSAAKIPTVIHNPGCMPPPVIRDLADLCVVFEDTHASFLRRVREGVFDLPDSAVNGVSPNDTTHESDAKDSPSTPAQNPWAAESPKSYAQKSNAEKERLRRAVVIHSVPLVSAITPDEDHEEQQRKTCEATEIKNTVISKAKEVAGALFVTELSAGFYESFSDGWKGWANEIAAAGQV